MTDEELQVGLVDAIQCGQLAEFLQSVDEATLSRSSKASLAEVRQACVQIRTDCTSEAETIKRGLKHLEIDAELHVADRTYHAFSVEIEPCDLSGALDVLAARGYQGVEALTPAARKALSKLSSGIELVKNDATSTRLTLGWANGKSRLGKLGLSLADCMHWSLPLKLWPLYLLARPARLVQERIFGRDKANLGGLVQGHVNLGTPDGLLAPLIAFADINSTDRVADIGAGDGRLLFAACLQTGCTGLGVEPNPRLGEVARARAAEYGIENKVTWATTDAQSCDLTGVTVALFFQPPHVLAQLLPSVCHRLPPQARVVAHEQIGLPDGFPRPETSRLIAASNGLTVAHRWHARAFQRSQDR